MLEMDIEFTTPGRSASFDSRMRVLARINNEHTPDHLRTQAYTSASAQRQIGLSRIRMQNTSVARTYDEVESQAGGSA